MDVLWPIEPKDAPRLPGYRLGVFQLGNNVEFHLEAYRAAFLAQASLIVLHDLALDDFVRGLRTLGDPLGIHGDPRGRRSPHEPDVAGRRPQRTAPRAVVRARRSSRARHHRALRVRQAIPGGGRLPDAGLRRAAPGRGVGWRHAQGRRSRTRAARATRDERDALARRGARRSERCQAVGRGARGHARARPQRPRRAGRSSDRGLRRRPGGRDGSARSIA